MKEGFTLTSFANMIGLIPIFVVSLLLTGCTKSHKSVLKDFVKHHHPYEFVEVIEVYEQLDSVYDPYDELMRYFNHPEEMPYMTSVDAALSERGKAKNAIGRKARVKYLYGPEDIIVYYDNNDNIKHISLQNKDLAQKALMRYFDRMHDRSWWHYRRPR